MNTLCHEELYQQNTSRNSAKEKIENFLGRIYANIKQYYTLRRQRNIDRQAFSHLHSLEDHILADIGVTRDDVNWAGKLPLEKNAACELQKIARQRSCYK